MMKTKQRLALVERQRRFEWELARDAQTRAAGQFVSGKTHDLLNLVQIVQLATLELGRRCPQDAQEFIGDLTRAADDAKHQLASLMALARPDEVIAIGAPVAAAIAAAVDEVRAASTIAIELQLAVEPEITTRCQADELAHLIYGLALDALTAAEAASAAAGEPTEPSSTTSASSIELFARARTIEGRPWLEIVRTARTPLDGEHFELRAVEAIAAKNGGELAHSERRDGASELVVALPIVPARPLG
jgi:hypothetical protein